MKKMNKRGAFVLECTPYLIISFLRKYKLNSGKKAKKQMWAVVLGVWLNQPTVVLMTLRRKRNIWISAMKKELWLTGRRLVQGWFYRRSDHLICSLADWRTWVTVCSVKGTSSPLRATRCTTCWGSLSRITLQEAAERHSRNCNNSEYAAVV